MRSPLCYEFYKKLLDNPLVYRWYLLLGGESYSIRLDFPFDSVPRWGYGKPSHPKLYELINAQRDTYRDTLQRFLSLKEYLVKIPRFELSSEPSTPYWMNGWIPGLDGVALYSLLVFFNPKHYLEIGSGISTKFARRAIRDHNLRTKIISIDPHPRAEIDSICDTVIRQPLENVNLTVFDALEDGDVVFVDGSHRVFMNSDVTVFFLDVLPKLKQGVLIHIHEIFLPYDYPPEWRERYLSEQYLLAVSLLAGSERFEILLPNVFISRDQELSKVLLPLWTHEAMGGIESYGYSCYLKIK